MKAISKLSVILCVSVLIIMNAEKSFGFDKKIKLEDGYKTIYDSNENSTEKLKLPSNVTKALSSINNKMYLLAYDDSPLEIYNIDGTLDAKFGIKGEPVSLADNCRTIVRHEDKNHREVWDMFDEDGYQIFELSSDIYVTGARFIDNDHVVVWGKNLQDYCIIMVYKIVPDLSVETVYEKTFGGATDIEKVITNDSKIIVFTSTENFDNGKEETDNNDKRVSVSVIDYLNGTQIFGSMLKTDQEISIDAELSDNNKMIAGVINNSAVFLIDAISGKIRYVKPLLRKINGSKNVDVIQIKTSNDGKTHVLRHSFWPIKFVSYEVYNVNGDMVQIHIFDDMDSDARMSIDASVVNVCSKNKTETILLHNSCIYLPK